MQEVGAGQGELVGWRDAERLLHRRRARAGGHGVGVGHGTTEADVDVLLSALPGAVARAARAGYAAAAPALGRR